MSGFGGSGWGGGPWGGILSSFVTPTIDVTVSDTITILSDDISYNTPLRVSQAVALSLLSVRVDFSQAVDPTYPPLSLISNYTIPGLVVTGVTIFSPTQVVLQTTPAQLAITYVVTVGDAVSLNGDFLGADDSAAFNGFVVVPTFFAGAESPIKVEVRFSTAMLVNAALTNPASYSLVATDGGAVVPISSVTISEATPKTRVTLHLGANLVSKNYYALVLSNTILSLVGSNVSPNMYIFQWADMTQPVFITPLEVPIRDFSGEIRGGLLGEPDGQVFFSPAFEDVSAQSTIQLEEVSVCTKAFDTYEVPSIPDPIPLMTFSRGITSVIGPTSVLWATAERLGQARLNVSLKQVDALPQAYDSPCYGTLVETIDITKASFLNDIRWNMFPGTTVFQTASNLTSIGPGPTSRVTLESPKIEKGDNVDITETLTVQRL